MVYVESQINNLPEDVASRSVRSSTKMLDFNHENMSENINQKKQTARFYQNTYLKGLIS